MRRPHRGRPTEAKTEEGLGFYRALGDKRPYRGLEFECAARRVGDNPPYLSFDFWTGGMRS